MRMSFFCCPYLQGCVLLAAGVLVGLWAPSWLPHGAALANEDKAGAEENVRKLKLELPAVSKPTNTLVYAVRVGDMLFVSGTGPGKVEGKARGSAGWARTTSRKGKAGRPRQVGLQILAVVKAEVGQPRQGRIAWSRPSAWSTPRPISSSTRRSSTASAI